jgi:N-acetylmuramoyl-L-alanine amidase
LLGIERPPGLADVADVRHWSYPSYTRVVVELTAPIETIVKRLPPDRRAGRPERLYFDLRRVWVGRRYIEPLRIADGLLRGVRLGQNTLSHTRVVLDLDHFTHYRLLHLTAPDRVVVDVFGARGRRGAPRRDGHSSAVPPLPMEARPLRTVVIDPGHGGRDPGAIGVGGTREKDVTLELARRLRRRLQANGYRVVLTRSKDTTLDLEERTAQAEGAGGDVFVSLHANAAPRSGAEGIEIFTLDERAERQTLRLAARENGVPPTDVDSLQRTISRLRLSETSTHSSQLADLMYDEIVSGMGKEWPSVRQTRVRKGPFYVLYLSSMPSVLVEVGFLTNRRDVRRLRDPKYLDALAGEIAEALGRYASRISTRVAERAP